MSPMNRAAFLSAFGAEQVAKAEQAARARVAEYRAAVENSTYHRNECAADAFDASGEVPAVGSFVWGRWSCMKGEGGPMGELEDLERMDQEGRENPRRLCEVVAVVDASPSAFLDKDFADGVARRFKEMGGSRYDEGDPMRLDGIPYTWEAVFCVRCAGRWYLIDGQGYEYTRYLLFPCDFRAMFREELAGITAARKAQERAAIEAARVMAERRRAEYLERCAKWAPYMTDATAAQQAYDATPWRDRKAHAAALRKLGAIRRGNIAAMIRAAFPALKFSVKKWDGWGGAYEVTYIDGPTEEEFTAALDLDLFAAIVDTFDGMTDCEGVERMEFTDFARQYMGDMYGGVRVSREMSDEARAELLDTLAGIAPAVCDVVGGRSVFLTMAEMSQFAAAVGLSLSAFNHYAHGEGYQDHPGVFARRAWVERSYMTAAPVPSPTTPTDPTKGRGSKPEADDNAGASYGVADKSPISKTPGDGLQLVDIAGGGVAVTGDSRATYKARKEIKSHGATWNKAAKQWEAHSPEAVAALREWFGVTVQDATPEASAPEESAPMVADDPAPMDTAAPASEVAPMATPTDQGTDHTSADGVQGAAYGLAEKSQIFMNPGEVYKTAKANRYIIILSDDGDKIRTTDAVLGRFSGNIDKSDKESFLNCLEAGSIIKADASQLPPVTDVHTWREGLENGYADAFQIRTELIYAAADAMTEAEKADTAARMGFSLPLDPLAVMDAAALHKWNASRGNYKNCAALEWLVTQQDEPAAFQMNAGAYPVIFADYARRI